MLSEVGIWMVTAEKSWFYLSFVKTPRVVIIRRELTPELTSGSAI
jgi:hypothetical protein